MLFVIYTKEGVWQYSWKYSSYQKTTMKIQAKAEWHVSMD